MARRFLALSMVLVMIAGCDSAEQTPEQGTDWLDVSISTNHVDGVFVHQGVELTFEADVLDDGTREVTLNLRGMTLLFTADAQTGVFDVDGFAEESAEDTQMGEADRVLINTFEKAFAPYYDAHAATNGAVDVLNRATTLFGDYSDTLELQRTFYGRFDQSASLCSSVNKAGQGVSTKKWKSATHDCNSTAGDCSNWWGCSRWDDNSTTSYVFMSMHPDGSCSDETYFGGSSSSFSCYEPDHPGGTEYSYGGCFGRCGGSCGSGTAFTRDCLDHDQCVRLGHSIASFWCDDELTGAAWDAMWAGNCSGANFTVDYDWAGWSYEGNCPSGWKDSNDGCDVGCQWIDGDCFR